MVFYLTIEPGSEAPALTVFFRKLNGDDRTLPQALYYLFKGIEVDTEGFFAGAGDAVAGVGPAADEAFFGLYIIVVLQGFEVRSQVTVGYIQQLFEVVKTHMLVDHERAHDADAHTAVKHFIELLYGIHLWGYRRKGIL